VSTLFLLKALSVVAAILFVSLMLFGEPVFQSIGLSPGLGRSIATFIMTFAVFGLLRAITKRQGTP
jgi:hypothetical protein